MFNITHQTSNSNNYQLIEAESIVVYSVISGLTILTNVSMLVLIISERKLHTMSNWIMASMFFTGIIFGLFYLLPRWALHNLWVYKDPIACTVLPQTGLALILNFNLHLTLVSLDRYLCVMFPIKYKIRKTYLTATLSVVTI
ncbi:5-hydroxytryptamine receptor 6, partial [Trichoplax sp. H2]